MPVTGCTYYETKLSAVHNIRLEFVRQVDKQKVYCVGKNKSGKVIHEFSGYYFLSELKQIQI